jgi:pyruvate dehydrogenase E2 component (dihydrolipoamide acetyltransferase)
MSDEPGRGESVAPRMGVARRAMARRMLEAGGVPAFYLRRSADITDLIAARQALRERAADPVPSVNDFLVRAVALALREHPHVNASWEDEAVLVHSRVNVGVAVAVEGGLVVPALYDADRRDVHEIALATRELVELARARRLSRELLADSTFTLSNLGMFGIEDFDPLVNPPQAAILGVGAGAVGADGRTRLRLTMGCDHRVLTGAEGAPFLATVAGLLERAEPLTAPAAATTEVTG